MISMELALQSVVFCSFQWRKTHPGDLVRVLWGGSGRREIVGWVRPLTSVVCISVCFFLFFSFIFPSQSLGKERGNAHHGRNILRALLFVQELINYQNLCFADRLCNIRMYAIIHGIRIIVMPCYVLYIRRNITSSSTWRCGTPYW